MERRHDGENRSLSRSGRFSCLTGLSLWLGWGIRGNFGHEYGAMMPGALAAMAAVLLSGRDDWQPRIAYFAMFGALGWSFGGSISYMQVVGYTHSGHSPSVLYGFACLFVIGFLWAALGGAGTALPAVVDRSFLEDLLVSTGVVFLLWWLQGVAIEPWLKRQGYSLFWYDTDWVAASLALVAVLAGLGSQAPARPANVAGPAPRRRLVGRLSPAGLGAGAAYDAAPRRQLVGLSGDDGGAPLVLPAPGSARSWPAPRFSADSSAESASPPHRCSSWSRSPADTRPTGTASLSRQQGSSMGSGSPSPSPFWRGGRLRSRSISTGGLGPIRSSAGFVVLGITYINLRKNVSFWIAQKVVPAVMSGMATWVWFDLAYLLLAVDDAGTLGPASKAASAHRARELARQGAVALSGFALEPGCRQLRARTGRVHGPAAGNRGRALRRRAGLHNHSAPGATRPPFLERGGLADR